MTVETQLEHKERLRVLRRLRDDFPFFARKMLRIRDKAGNMVPFQLNSAQQYVHRRVEEQLAETGKVRAIVLKGRQQGISTYVGGRYYHRASTRKGVNVYILAHEQSASDNLFSMVDRYQRHNKIAPHTGIANAKELRFDKLDSGYVVATAGQKAGGRSRASTLMHGSEVGFWTNAAEHFSASVQTIPDMDDTEIILESTADGPSGEFYERWHDAMAGKSDYQAIFVPWFWQSEYRRPVDDKFRLYEEGEDDSMSEAEYAELFGLDNTQMAWRRMKIAEFRSHRRFDREYPATPDMAFVTADVESFIKPLQVLKARKRKDVSAYGPLILGVDPAGPGGDRFAIAARKGAKVLWVRKRNKLQTAQAYQWVKAVIEEMDPDRVNIDAGGIGHSVISLLRTDAPQSVAKLVRAINFGAPSEFKNATPKLPGPKNRRAEMWSRLRDWLELEEGVSLPDEDVIQSDITGPRTKPTLTNDLMLESKDEMRARGVRSPDLADAIVLTFASLSAIKAKNPGDTPRPEIERDREAVRRVDSVTENNFATSDNSWMA